MRTGPSPVGALVAAALAIAAGACSSAGGSTYPADAPARTAQDVPERFVGEGFASGGAAADTLPGGGCRSPLVDPRDGTQIRMMNAQAVVGDYAVPEGRYGVGPGEWLRIECNTGRVVGIVPARS